MSRVLYDMAVIDSRGQSLMTRKFSFNFVLSCKCQMQTDFGECQRLFCLILPRLSCQVYQEVNCSCSLYCVVLCRLYVTKDFFDCVDTSDENAVLLFRMSHKM